MDCTSQWLSGFGGEVDNSMVFKGKRTWFESQIEHQLWDAIHSVNESQIGRNTGYVPQC